MEEIFRFLVVPCAHCRGCASDTYVIISRLPVYLKTSQGGRVLCYVKKWKKIRSLVEKLDCVKTFEQEGSLCEESKCIRFKSRIKTGSTTVVNTEFNLNILNVYFFICSNK